MAKLFMAESLNNLLHAWEDYNIYGDFLFEMQMMNKHLKIKSDPDISTYIGSEITPLGILGRSIPGYENLRKILMGHPYNHERNFMPRIPKESREKYKFDRIFADYGYILPHLQVPRFLLKWNETRRACIVEDSLPIPMIDIRNENHFNKLPYKSFFLRIASPLVFAKSEQDEESTMDSFLIYDDGNFVRILGWSREAEVFLLTDKQRKNVLEDTKLLRKKKDFKGNTVSESIYSYFMLNFGIVKEKPEVLIPNFHSRRMNLTNIYDTEEYNSLVYHKYRAVLELINGFCKIMATLPPSPSIKIEGVGVKKTQPLPPRQWFELPQQSIEYLQTSRVNDVVVIRRGYDSEKSPHIRRAHTRRIIHTDGRVEEIWIEQATIRADRLVTDQLQGGAICIT